MSTKKVNYSMANSISSKIADKAFQHLTEPLERALSEIADTAYARIIEKCGINTEVVKQMNVFSCTDSTSIDICNGSGQEVVVSTTSVKEGWLDLGPRWNNPEYVDEELFNKAFEINSQLDQINSRRNELQRTLMQQIEGRTIKQVLDAWPEAAPFLGIAQRPDMIRPLERLLAQYLPALPAPEEEAHV